MTIQKCERIARIQHLEREIRESVVNLSDLVAAEDRAVSKENKAQARFSSFIKVRSSKASARRRRDFLTQYADINTHLNRVKNELRSAHEDHKQRLEQDHERKAWWARERVRRVEEENRRAATTAAEAARRRAEKARQQRNTDPEAAQAAKGSRQQTREEATRAAREAKAEEESRRRAERARSDAQMARWRRDEGEVWLAGGREELLESERKERGAT